MADGIGNGNGEGGIKALKTENALACARSLIQSYLTNIAIIMTIICMCGLSECASLPWIYIFIYHGLMIRW